jgi:hypothetical protein
MQKTLTKAVADATATQHKLLPARQFLSSQRWTESDIHLRVLSAIVKIWDEGGGMIDDEVLASRFGIIMLPNAQLDQIVDALVTAGLLERIRGSEPHVDDDDTISVSARGLNLASELSLRHSEALLNDQV